MFEHKGVNKILYGGDYNPEQWDEEPVTVKTVNALSGSGLRTSTVHLMS